MSGVYRLRGRLSGRLLGVAAVAAVLIGSGAVAYACGQGGGCGGPHQPACPVSEGIFWTSTSAPVPSASNVRCTISISSSTNTLIEQTSNLAPAQSCGFAAQLKNVGRDAVTITERLTPTEPVNCRLFGYSDNVPSSPHPSIASGHYFSYRGTVSLSASAGNACNHSGTYATFYVVITATPYTRCSR